MLYENHNHNHRCSYEKVFWEYAANLQENKPMPKCDFICFSLQLYWNHTSALVFLCKFATYFKNTFYKNIFKGLLL